MASNMLMQLSLLHFIFLFLTPSFSSNPISKPGCPDQCGNVSIPFPFGIGSDCSHNPFFNISCDTSTNNSSPKAYLFGSVEVVEINGSHIRTRIKSLLNLACYNESGGYVNGTAEYSQSFVTYDTPYTFSEENWITVLGCDDLVTIFGSDIPNSLEDDEQKIGTSCVSYCTSNKTDSDGVGFCPVSDSEPTYGKGCCSTTLPRGMTRVSTQLTDLSITWRSTRKKQFSCSYAFIHEKVTSNELKFTFPLSYLNNPNQFVDDSGNWKAIVPPIVRLDWRINESKNCSHAQGNTIAYACRNHSVCVDFDATNGGYSCLCEEGYEGNPYLVNGCQDIDECSDSRTNPCRSNSLCINTEGSFICSCPKGYHGDGMKNGSGCIQSKMITIFIGVGSGLGFIMLLSACVLLRKALQKRKMRMRKARFFKQNGGLLLRQRKNEGTVGTTRIFLVEELEKATDKFNQSRFLGQGGQGIVYKGMLSDGMIVAIKKSKLLDKHQLEQFINEVVILSQINHRNIVHLLGCCLETEVPLLVYEFLPNGTLSDLIHDPRVEFPISWNMHLKMASDIAGALAYLHSASSIPIYHRDIKSSNILLDEKYVVKVSDFGISRTVSVDRTHVTTRVQGTFGYFDPEYFQSNQFTEKSDVYSFGVVLAELLTGQKPISQEEDEEEKSLVARFLASIENSNLDAMLDPQVSEGVKEEVNAVALLASRCLNLHGRMRPTMKQVALELDCLRLSQMPRSVSLESEETTVYEFGNTMSSDTEQTWTTSDINEIPSSSSNTHPLKL